MSAAVAMDEPVAVDRTFLLGQPLPNLSATGSKDDRGTILVVAGSREVPGAALLAATAALRVGAGKLQIATVRSMSLAMAIVMPEARVISLRETGEGEIDPAELERLVEDAAKADAVLLGPGMVEETGSRSLALGLIERIRAPMVLDAAAITSLASDAERLRRAPGRLVLTPHAGEMAAFLGQAREAVEADPAQAGLEAARRTGAVVAMKGDSTFVCEHGEAPWLCEGGGVGMATSGSGDVLSGVVAGLLARGAAPRLATQWGVFLHAEAGRRLARRIGTVGFLARELLDELPLALEDHRP
ncbi:NAD(P)H-hydrate dehydratase [Aureimonas sp. AU4]|uniref:NAD(P)H-hydrate dehydratase n=1 Tax=Aureimonas sp. AU4 TaxID=1638163 RepID=UPI000AEF0332|nr:NAD(P)H-hydrate dehydratase [Aureimonas sp. AU4]